MCDLPRLAGVSSPAQTLPSLSDSLRPRRLLYRYFAREICFPMLFALAALTLIVLTQDLLGYTDLVINRGLGVGAVARMAFYQAVALTARTLPFAVLLGTLVALGRLGADRELLALEASGLSERALVRPLMGFAAGMTVVGLALSLFGAPWAGRTLDASLAEIARTTPGAVLRAGTVHHFGSWRLEARQVSSEGTRMRGVLLWMAERGQTVFAKAGALDPTPAGATQVTLDQGVVVLDPRHAARMLRFDRMWTELPEADQPLGRTQMDELGGASVSELRAQAQRPETPVEEVWAARIELHRRFALPAATLVFGLLALPLSLMAGRFSRSAGAMTGIVATIAYYGLVQLGTGLIEGGVVGVGLGVWLPNLLLAPLAAALVLRLGRGPGFSRHLLRPSRQARRRDREAALGGARARPRARRRVLDRYVAGRFTRMALLSFSLLLVAYLLVDVLERLDTFARHHASAGEVVRYYAARLPLLASRVLPMSLLVATSLTVGLLNAGNELLGMRACGLHPLRALLPVILLSALIAPAFLALNEAVVPRTNAIAHYLKNVEIRGRPLSEPGRGAVWYRLQDRVYEAESLDPGRGSAYDLVVYEIGEDGLPTSRTDARGAHYIGAHVWRLLDPVRVEVSAGGIAPVPAAPFAELGTEVPAEVHTGQLSMAELRRAIREIERAGYDATPCRVDLYTKAMAPLACLLLPALALFFALGGPPHPGVSGTLVFSAVVAVSYVLLSGVGSSLGYGGVLPPAVAGAAPTAFFALLAAGYGLRLRGFGRVSG